MIVINNLICFYVNSKRYKYRRVSRLFINTFKKTERNFFISIFKIVYIE